MTVSALLRRLDDWINPIVIKELRQAVKSRMVVTILLLFLGLQLLILGFYLLAQETRGGDRVDWYAGNDVFKVQQGILLWTLAILVPAYAAVRLGAERSDQNVDLLFISTLRPGSIIWGKFVAALALAILIFSTCAPFMTFTYLLRGIDLPTILSVLLVDLVAMLFGTMAALLMGSMPGNRALKFGLAFLGFIALAYLTAGVTVMTVALSEVGVGWLELPEYWGAYLMGLLTVLGAIGAMYFCCVALISPPSSNRTLALRVYLTALWLLLAGGTWWVSVKYEVELGSRPVIIWLLVAPALVSLLFLVSISERDRWGPRITRAVPRAWWGRLAAWLFYTGAGGGVLLCAALMVGSFLLAALLLEARPGRLNEDGAWVMLRVMTVAALYLYCYGLSAALLRAHVLGPPVKPSITWLLFVLLVGVGSSIPAVISFVLSMDRRRPYTEVQWWMVPNPFVAAYQMIPGPWRGPNEDFSTVAQWFLGIWALLTTGLAMPWYAGMLRRFRPLERAPAPLLAEVVADEAPAPRQAAPLPEAPYVTPADS